MNPENLPLSSGQGTPERPCLMSKASLVHAHRNGYLGTAGVVAVFSDSPCWADPIVRPMVVFANDSLPDGSSEYARLDKLLDRVLNATKISDTAIERRVHARVLCKQARKVLGLVHPEDREVCERAIAAREAWLLGEASEDEARGAAEAAWAAWAAGAAGAAWAEWGAGAAEAAWAAWAAEAARAAGAAEAAEAAWAEQHAVHWLDEFLDDLEKAKAEEGVMVDDGWLDAVKEHLAVDIALPEADRRHRDRSS